MSENNQFLRSKVQHWARDITALANPIVIIFTSLITLGLNSTFYQLLLLLAINEIFCSLIKLAFHRPRPDGQTFQGSMVKVDAGSFPSIHSSRIMLTYITIFFQSGSPLIQGVIIFMILAVGTSRVMLKRHYWSDVIAGFIIGLAIYFIGSYFFA